MKRRNWLAETLTEDGKKMTLSERAGEHTIEIEGQVLMSTRAPGSEKRMAELAAAELAKVDQPRLLIGGLGMGFTLGAALDALPATASVVVVECFSAIVAWNREFRFESPVDRLADPRVAAVVGDVVEHLHASTQPFDAILLDVDNGPEAWCLSSNARLYSRPGLRKLRRRLKPGGLLVVWSAQRSPKFEARLVEARFTVRIEVARSRDLKGERHTIYLANTPPRRRPRKQ